MHDDPRAPNSADAGGGDSARPAAGDEARFLTEPCEAHHDYSDFRCERSPRVAGFFHNEMPLYRSTNFTRVFVYLDGARVMGYYTLSAAAMARSRLVNRDTRRGKTPEGIDAPMVRIGFLGRDDRAEKGLGAALLLDAAKRIAVLPIGVFGITLDAESRELGEKFYAKVGFEFAKVRDGDSTVSATLMYAPLHKLLTPAAPA